MGKEVNSSRLSDYFRQLPGKHYVDFEQQQLDALLPKIPGYFLVQLGLAKHYSLSMSRANYCIYAGTPIEPTRELMVQSNLVELPFQANSIDIFYLPHTLEYSSNPQKLINELYQCLAPGGKLILFGFNPFGTMGLIKLLALINKAPWLGHLYGIINVKSWLLRAGFSLSVVSRFPRIYMLVAEKKVIPMQPIKVNVKRKKIPLRAGFPEPSTNESI